MKFETLRSNKKILLIGVVFVLAGLTLMLNVTKAKYRTTERINVAKGTINYSLGDTNLMGIYIQDGEEYISSDAIPESGYKLNSDESYCKKGDTTLDTTITYDISTKTLNITPMTEKGTKCYLYFDEKIPSASEAILANITTTTTRSSFSSPYTASTTGTIFTAEDDDGTSYYFAGAPTDNWVKFGGFYWRIVRINGDGTIRLIYNGTSTTTIGDKTVAIQSIQYNISANNNMYVGYMYTSGSVHGYGTASNIKTQLDSWYDSNLASYASKIDTSAGFCNDRAAYTDTSGLTSGGGTGTTTTYYAGYVRLVTNKLPSFKCSDNNDLFTASNSGKGNKKLSKSIGLITADEVVYAGGVYAVNNTSYYLYNNQYYWTMTPYYYYEDDNAAYMFYMHPKVNLKGNGGFMSIDVAKTSGVRPVINLRSDVTFKDGGLGTAEKPYELNS